MASFSGTLTLWALGGTQESGVTNFTVGPAWTLVSAPVDVADAGHTGLRAEIYMATTGTNLDADAASMAAGNAQTPRADPWPPRASLRRLPAQTLRHKVTITWSGTDAGSGIQSYDLRWRRAAYNSAFTSWRYPVPWQRTTSTSGSLTLSPGYQYCLQVRARDNAGNLSTWSSQRCVTRPLDDRALTAGPGWSRRTGPGYYMRTYTQTNRKDRILTLAHVTLQQAGLVATNCRHSPSVPESSPS